jgi:hypothetical protein
MIFGLGTGRCGTGSLAKILDLSHEACSMPWQVNLDKYNEVMPGVIKRGGDVALYWLPYVSLVLEDYPDSKFVCLKRDREETIQSWSRRLPGTSKFMLASVVTLGPNGKHYESLFPDYGDTPVPEAVGMFWDEYYEKSEALQRLIPESFTVVGMNAALNDRAGQRRMLDFCGLHDQPVRLGVHKNKMERNPIISGKEFILGSHGDVPEEAIENLRRGARIVNHMKRSMRQ